jgi:hypothetical protein
MNIIFINIFKNNISKNLFNSQKISNNNYLTTLINNKYFISIYPNLLSNINQYKKLKSVIDKETSLAIFRTSKLFQDFRQIIFRN